MDAKLSVVGGKASKKAIALKLPTVIGRSRNADLTVVHPMISRRHCEIFERDGLLMLRDLGSLNGIVVGSDRVTETPLRPGDEFTVGPLTFRADYEYDGDLESVPEPTIAQQQAAEPTAECGGQAADFDAFAEAPEFGFLDAPPEPAAAEELPNFSAWDQPVTQPQEDPLPADVEPEEITEVDQIEEIDEDEEEEPEPTPPPPLPPRKEPRSESAPAEPAPAEPAATEPAPAESVEEPPEPKPAEKTPPSRKKEEAAAEPASPEPVQAAESENAESLPDFFANLSPDADKPASAKTEDDDLNEFFKGFQ